MTLKRTLAATAAGLALTLAPMTTAFAQDGSGAEAAPDADSAVPDALLESFVLAALNVSEIAQMYQGRIQSAEDDAARQELATEAREAMLSAVEETDGITVEEYVTISEAAQTDEALNQRVMEQLSEMAPAE